MSSAYGRVRMTPPPKATNGTTAATIHGYVVSKGTIMPSPYTHRPTRITRARPTRSPSLPETGDAARITRAPAPIASEAACTLSPEPAGDVEHDERLQRGERQLPQRVRGEERLQCRLLGDRV